MHKEENGDILLDSYPVEILLTKKGVASIVRDDFVENPRLSYEHFFHLISFCPFFKIDDHCYNSAENLFNKTKDSHFIWSLSLKIEKNEKGTHIKKFLLIDKTFNINSKYFAITDKNIWRKGNSLSDEVLQDKILPFLEKDVDEFNNFENHNIYTVQCDILEEEFEEKGFEIPWIVGNDIKKNGLLSLLDEIYVDFKIEGIEDKETFISFSTFRDFKDAIFSTNNIISLIENDFKVDDLGEIVVISKNENEEIFLKPNLLEELFDTSNETPFKTTIKEVLIEGYKKKYNSIF